MSVVRVQPPVFEYALALQEQGQLLPALEVYRQLLAAQPQHVNAHINCANVLRALGQPGQAMTHYDQAIALQPSSALAHYNRGVALQDLQQHAAALADYDAALALGADFPELHNNRGNALLALQQVEAALQSYTAALVRRADYSQAHHNQGAALQKLHQHQAALQSYQRAMELQPDYPFLPGMCLHMRMHLANWDGFDTALEQLEGQVLAGQTVAPPFALLALSGSAQVQMRAAASWARHHCPLAPTTTPSPPTPRQPGRLRVGYFSADFYSDTVKGLLMDVLAQHDRTQFELIGFSFGPFVQDERGQQLLHLFDKLIDVRALPDANVAQLARQLGVDIAVDLMGYTHNSRPGIFAHRAAPVQVNYLGYPGTMAAPFMDYIIADRTVIAQESEPFFSETMVLLPDSYQPNDRFLPLPQNICQRQSLGLPEGGFVFCCFNATYKITPATFDGWMRILLAVPGSVLWLLQGSAQTTHNLRQEAEKRGVQAARLVFAPPMARTDHLVRHRCADLFLDTLPCNAHTTAADALRAGLPVLTCLGSTFAGRVAASVLRAAGLPELVTTSQAGFEALAIALALDPQRLAALKHKVLQLSPTTPIFDGPRYTRHLEAAFLAIALAV